MIIDENEAFGKCITILKKIGITVHFTEISAGALLPGFEIRKGVLYINRETMLFPGDVLHEAGHIAVVPPLERALLENDNIGMRENREAEEMMAIAWSYAACLHLQIDPHFVFHDKGYKGGGSSLVENFTNKRYIGLPMLQWIGLAADEERAATLNILPYPNMIKWIRE